jgi:hypothetical protein
MISWFGPLEKQLKEGLFYGHFLQNIFLEEMFAATILV